MSIRTNIFHDQPPPEDGTLVRPSELTAHGGHEVAPQPQPQRPASGSQNDHLQLQVVPASAQVCVVQHPHTRVMSPNVMSNELVTDPSFMVECQRCQQMCTCPVMCGHCGQYGHQACMQLEVFQGLPFCSICMCQVIQTYSLRKDAEQRLAWARFYTEQRSAWRARATTALGVSMAVGAAVGAVTATAAGAAAGVAVGLARGAQSAISTTRGRDPSPEPLAISDQAQGESQVPAEHPEEYSAASGVVVGAPGFSIATPPPEPHTALRPVAKSASRRSFSVGRRPDPAITMGRKQAEREGHCLACHTPNTSHYPHLWGGDCVGFPGRTYYGQRSREERGEPSFISADSAGRDDGMTARHLKDAERQAQASATTEAKYLTADDLQPLFTRLEAIEAAISRIDHSGMVGLTELEARMDLLEAEAQSYREWETPGTEVLNGEGNLEGPVHIDMASGCSTPRAQSNSGGQDWWNTVQEVYPAQGESTILVTPSAAAAALGPPAQEGPHSAGGMTMPSRSSNEALSYPFGVGGSQSALQGQEASLQNQLQHGLQETRASTSRISPGLAAPQTPSRPADDAVPLVRYEQEPLAIQDGSVTGGGDSSRHYDDVF